MPPLVSKKTKRKKKPNQVMGKTIRKIDEKWTGIGTQPPYTTTPPPPPPPPTTTTSMD